MTRSQPKKRGRPRKKTKVEIPYNYEPREYQKPFWKAMDQEGFLRAVLVWHRRAGKDKTLINFTIKKMFQRVGAYYYFFPTYTQGSKILWEGMDRDGFKFIDHFPPQSIVRTDSTKMLVELVNGSIFQIIGTDKIDSVVGTNPVGCVFSEYALQDPQAWAFIRPILAENSGWAVFNFTPRGNNHGKQIWDLAQADEAWYSQLLKASDTGAIPESVLRQEREEIIRNDGNDALYQQEYECSFEVPIQGAYFGSQLMQAEEEERIREVPYEPDVLVHTSWDLGVDDTTAVWFWQEVGRERRFIDHYETSGEGLAHYAKVLQDKNYVYGKHFAPHDIKVRELGTGKSRWETAKGLGIKFEIVENKSVADGIEAARNILARCWFDKVKCEKGLNALKSYHKEYDEKNQRFKDRPHHDWASNSADSFRMFAVSNKDSKYEVPEQTFNKKKWEI